MIRDIVLQHKLEKEKYLARNYVLRQRLDFASKFLDSKLIKIITGPRRAGKSIFSFLLLKNKDFAYLNFDDESFLKVTNYDEIIKAIFEVYPQSKFFLFDEIQNLKNWELFVNKLQRREYNLILTGSNAKLLDKELAGTLTGRYVPIEILPFSFKEFLAARDIRINEESFRIPEIKGKVLNFLSEYLKNGGFPEIVVTGVDVKVYLETLFDAVLFKDVVKRYKVRFPQKIYDLAVYLITAFCSEYTFNKLKNVLEFRSTRTVQNYLEFLEDAYLFFSLNRFSFKMREQIKSAKKIYLVDNGLIFAKAFQFTQNFGRLMENLVFTEILRKGYKLNQDLFYYKTRNGREVDFILKEELKIKELIQVCYDASNLEVKKREVKSLIEAGKELNCDEMLIITWDYEDKEEIDGKKINLVPLWKWLLLSIGRV